MEFAYDGDGLGKGGKVTLYYDGKAVGNGRVDRTQPMAFSADEACDVGADSGSPASPDYGPTGNAFSGHRLGANRPRPGQPRPLDHGRGPIQHRDVAAIVGWLPTRRRAAVPGRLTERDEKTSVVIAGRDCG